MFDKRERESEGFKFVSGLLYNRERERPERKLVKGDFKSFVVLYVYIYLCMYIYMHVYTEGR